MTSESAPDLTRHAQFLTTTAARAPSVHNTQPWLFTVSPREVELYCDPARRLRIDPAGREMLISCGGALYGLRLALRSLGYEPFVELLPEPAQPRLLARVRVRAGATSPVTDWERKLMEAVPHRHTHRGPFTPGPLSAGLVAGLQRDALAERTTLVPVASGLARRRLGAIVVAAARHGDHDPYARADVRRWTRPIGSTARDGIPALAFRDRGGSRAGSLAQRDFDLGRGIGRLGTGAPTPVTEHPPAREHPPATAEPSLVAAPPLFTAVLVTAGDSRADWLHAGQALYRLLLRAASRWVFASLYTQPLEYTATRRLIRDQLALPGHPQMLLQLGKADTAAATARRPPGELTDP